MTKAFFSELIKVKFRLSAKFQVLYHILLESKALTLVADEAICQKPKAKSAFYFFTASFFTLFADRRLQPARGRKIKPKI
jgi:hypothetical protein